MKTFYISTPIYYPSGKPHIGHAYSTILADVLSRYKKIIGYDVFFLTGTDEHGQKIQEKSTELSLTPIDFVNNNSLVFKELFNKLNIDYSFFIRTTFDFHKTAVQKTFTELYEKGFIYIDEWQGLYCVSCEENYTKTNAIEKDNEYTCQHGHKLINKKEESYFLKIKEFKEWILTLKKLEFIL